MATLAFSNKRSFDMSALGNATPAACSPHKIAFLDPNELIRPAKRSSSFLDTSGPVKRLRQLTNSSVGEASTACVLPIRDSAFAGVNVAPEEEFLKKKGKLCRQCLANPAERMFTSEELRAVVTKAVKRNEEELRYEYDRILQERLAEQFHNFSKCYEDSVSRMSKQTDFSYMS